MGGITALYKQQFESRKQTNLNWFEALRERAMEGFIESGMPGRNNEAWKYTPLTRLNDGNFSIEKSKVDKQKSVNHQVIHLLDGDLVIPKTLPKGVVICDLYTGILNYPELVKKNFETSLETTKDAFQLLNLALMQTGVFVLVSDNNFVEETIEISFETSAGGRAQHLRNIYLVGQGATVNIIERFCGDNTLEYSNQVISSVLAQRNSNVCYYKVQQESGQAIHIAETDFSLEKNARLVAHSYCFGGSLVRSDTRVQFSEPDSSCELNGLYVVSGSQHVDHHTYLDHQVERAKSSQCYKGILGGKAKAVFNGAIHVNVDAQKTDAHMNNKNLLLSDDAEVNTKPELEIFADDVCCAHGATVGQLDDKSLFYLRSRGLSEKDAEKMLVHAFASDLLEKVSLDGLKQELANSLNEKLRIVND